MLTRRRCVMLITYALSLYLSLSLSPTPCPVVMGVHQEEVCMLTRRRCVMFITYALPLSLSLSLSLSYPLSSCHGRPSGGGLHAHQASVCHAHYLCSLSLSLSISLSLLPPVQLSWA